MSIESFHSKIFLDSGDPDETRKAIGHLGFLDGQTTNPSLITRNPDAAQKVARGEKFTQKELLDLYKEIVQEISGLIPRGSVSIEVYADKNVTTEEMLEQGREMFLWIPNAHIKYPTTAEGLKAAQQSIAEGMRVNMTLVFSQQQAAAVYAATKGAAKGSVFVSPFIGRVDDAGENGMQLLENIVRMYKQGDGHVEVLAASLRNQNHLLGAIQAHADIITSPWEVLKEWDSQDPNDTFAYETGNFKTIPYQEMNLEQEWSAFDIFHDLTDKGIGRFADDWNKLLK